MKTKGKRFAAILLSMCMLLGMMPSFGLTALAAENDNVGLCEHHPEHTQECGYQEVVPGTPCLHEHDENCYQETTVCLHVHTEECYPEDTATSDGTEGDREPSACTHVCSVENGCITRQLVCSNENDEICDYTCEICSPKDSGSMMFSVSESDVCCIGDQAYASLQEAVNNANTSDTITMLKSTQENMLVPADSNLILDLNGFTLTQSEESTEPTPYAINNEGTLKIVDSGTVKGKIVNSLSSTTSCVRNNGSLTVNGITVESTFVAVKNEPTAMLEVDSCEFYSTYNGSGTGALLNWGNAAVSNTVIDAGSGASAVYVNSEGSLSNITLTNCDLAGKYAVTARKDGDAGTAVKIEGGSISSTSTTGVNFPSTVDGNIVGNIKVNGNAVNSVLKNSAAGTNVILNESASTKSNTTIPEGVILTIPEGVTYTVGKSHGLIANGSLVNEGSLVAPAYDQTGRTYYPSLQRAMDQAKGESTIQLLTDVAEETVTVKGGKQITLDLNGNTLTGGITTSGDLTISDTAEAPGMVTGALATSSGGELAITGGTFGTSVKEFVEDGLEFERNSNGVYTYHQTLQDALKDADADTVITAVNNAAADGNAYIATLVYNDDSGKTVQFAADADGKIILPSIDRSGYSFLGWDKGDGTLIAAGQSCTLTGNATFTGIWKEFTKVKTEAKAETCTKDGNIEYWYCPELNAYFEDEALTKPISLADTIIPAKGQHGEFEIKNAKAATCTEEGYTGDKVCKDCGEVIEQGKTIAKVAHTYKDGKCTACGAVDPDYRPTTGHGETEIRNAKAATCTEEGYTGDKVCKDCGEVLEKGKPIAKIAHTYKDGKCTMCGASDPDYRPTTEPTTPPKGDTEDSGSKPTDKPTSSPQTGDDSNILLWVSLLFVAGAGIVGVVLYDKRKVFKH